MRSFALFEPARTFQQRFHTPKCSPKLPYSASGNSCAYPPTMPAVSCSSRLSSSNLSSCLNFPPKSFASQQKQSPGNMFMPICGATFNRNHGLHEEIIGNSVYSCCELLLRSVPCLVTECPVWKSFLYYNLLTPTCSPKLPSRASGNRCLLRSSAGLPSRFPV